MPSLIVPTPSNFSLLPASDGKPRQPDAAPETAFHLYVHWPYCQTKCGYCDFASTVPKRRWDVGAWQEAYRRDIAVLKAQTGDRPLGSIFFGGGTPSLAEASLIGGIIDDATRAWAPRNDCEITLEANPGTVDKQALKDLRLAGVNRLSVGAQSFNDAGLTMLGRKHSVDDTKFVLDWAHEIFDRLSMDLITARPDLTPLDWVQELHQALEFAGEHLSIYQLTVEDGTPLARAVEAGRLRMPDEDTSSRLFEDTRQILASFGRPAYEVSNFAQPGAECRHNLAIWRGADYGGIGPAAHGRLTVDGRHLATDHTSDALTWLRAGGDGPHAEVLTVEERIQEHLMMNLRLNEGLSFARFRDLFADFGHAEPFEFFEAANLQEMVDLGFMAVTDDGIRCTESGIMLLNAVLTRVLKIA